MIADKTGNRTVQAVSFFSPFCPWATSFEIRADDCNEFLRALALSGCGFGGEDVMANMSFHDLVHEPVHGAARRCNQPKNFGAVLVESECLLNRLDLTLDSMDARQELPFGFRGM
jgi:hypothetical protein